MQVIESDFSILWQSEGSKQSRIRLKILYSITTVKTAPRLAVKNELLVLLPGPTYSINANIRWFEHRNLAWARLMKGAFYAKLRCGGMLRLSFFGTHRTAPFGRRESYSSLARSESSMGRFVGRELSLDEDDARLFGNNTRVCW